MVLAELVVDGRVRQGVLPDQALAVHEREMVALGKRLQRAFPRHLRGELPIGVVAIALVIPLRQFRSQRTQVSVEIDGGIRGEDRQMNPYRSCEGGSSTSP